MTSPAAGSINLSFLSGPANSAENTGVSATVSLDFQDTPTGDLLELIIENTTPDVVGSLLTAVGLEWPDDLGLPVFAPGGASPYFDVLSYDVSVAPAWLDASGGYDVMITSDGSFQGGNAQGAPAPGESQAVILDLGDTGMTAGQLETAFVGFYSALSGPIAITRFQAVGPGAEQSDKVVSTQLPVPEPTALMLLGVAGALALMHRPRGRAR